MKRCRGRLHAMTVSAITQATAVNAIGVNARLIGSPIGVKAGDAVITDTLADEVLARVAG